ncbi:hypothetical protein B0H34DRAFT_651326 [Crassisporium funariophilum]|nr:hypothetical protein B0H34DRAFT_651326 [Crassisporium funariophilum]
MYINNPYAQAGWSNPQNPHMIDDATWNPDISLPPTFGALPSPDDNPPSVLSFEFSSFKPDIFNCQVTGPENRLFFNIRTPNPSVTIVSKPDGDFAFIDWQKHCTVEARGMLARQGTRNFLKLSADQCYRTMVINGKCYAWLPRGNSVYLYSVGSGPPVQLGMIRPASKNTKILLQIASESFPAGLFEPCILVTVLLYSGRNLD